MPRAIGTIKLPDGKLMVQVTIESVSWLIEMTGHTGQSSQLFSDANSRNAEFLATAARSAVVQEVYLSNSRTVLIAMIAAMWLSPVFAQTFEII